MISRDLSIFKRPPGDRFIDDPVVLMTSPTNALDLTLRLALQEFREDFDHLSADKWLKSDYIFRERRYGRFALRRDQHKIEKLPEQGFFQSTENNSYAGGIERKFEPLESRTEQNPFLHQLMWEILDALPSNRLVHSEWEIGVHLMRVVARSGQPGYPAPEGMHQDGHAFTSITLIQRQHTEGGLSQFARLDEQVYREITLENDLDTVIFEDPQCLHYVTPVTVASGSTSAFRDVCGFSLNPIEAQPT